MRSLGTDALVDYGFAVEFGPHARGVIQSTYVQGVTYGIAGRAVALLIRVVRTNLVTTAFGFAGDRLPLVQAMQAEKIGANLAPLLSIGHEKAVADLPAVRFVKGRTLLNDLLR
jgi:hypothetical protein